MSRPDGAFAYAQPRLQARLALRPDTLAWQRLQASGDLAALLQVAAATVLAARTARLRSDGGLHELETRLREDWAECVDEVADWQPPAWRPALRWLRWLPWLPLLELAPEAGGRPDWVQADPRLAELAGAIASRPASAEGLLDAYLRRWRDTWPSVRHDLGKLLGLLHAHRQDLRSLPVGADSGAATQTLEQRLLLHLRRHPLTPAASVAWLGLAGLDWLRLRGLVLERAVQGPAGAP